MKTKTLVFCLFAALALPACDGTQKLAGPDPVPIASPAPAQHVIGLAFTARQRGRVVQVVEQNSLFTVEAGSRCTVTDLPCPRPSLMSWRVSGAFCETLGDTSGPSIVVLCSGYGVTRIEGIDLENGASGVAQIQVLFVD